MSMSRTEQTRSLNDIKARTLELALYTSDPAPAGSGTEVSGGSYARQTITFGSLSVVGDGTEMSNSAQINFPQASGDWSAGVAVSHFAVRETGGDPIAFGVIKNSGIATPRVVRAGDTFQVPIGAITIKRVDADAEP